MTDRKINRRNFFQFAMGSFVLDGVCRGFRPFESAHAAESEKGTNDRNAKFPYQNQKKLEEKTEASSPFTDLLVRKNPRTFRWEISFRAEIEGNPPEELNVILPVPKTNEYQIIENPEYPQDGKIRKFEGGKGRYLVKTFTRQFPFRPFKMSYDVTLYDVYSEWARLKNFYEYDRQSALYRMYTGKSGSCVDPNNPQIREIANQIADLSKNPLEYAHRAYLYVSDHFQYRDLGLNMLPLANVLKNGGGHCGNLTSIYVSLLRAQGIPSRHLVGKRPGLDTDPKSCHIWSDFYLENYGWIPADISQRVQAVNKGDWFGRAAASTGMIVHYDTDLVISLRNRREKVLTLQNYYTSWRYSSDSAPRITASLIYKEI